MTKLKFRVERYDHNNICEFIDDIPRYDVACNMAESARREFPMYKYRIVRIEYTEEVMPWPIH